MRGDGQLDAGAKPCLEMTGSLEVGNLYVYKGKGSCCGGIRNPSCVPRGKLNWIIIVMCVLFFQPDMVCSQYNDCQKFATSDTLQEITRAINLLEIHIRQNIQVKYTYFFFLIISVG